MIRNLRLQITQLINQTYSTESDTTLVHSTQPNQSNSRESDTKLQKLKQKTKNKMCEPTPCPICYEDLGEKNIAVMDCGHKFHFKCMVKWNSTDNGDTCPLCRTDLGLPDLVDSSDEDEEGVLMISDFENDLDEDDFNYVEQGETNSTNTLEQADSGDGDNGTTDDEDEDDISEDEEHENNELDLRETRYEIGQLLDTLGGNFGLKMGCECCKQSLLQCNFCSEPFCACKNTADKPQFKANPFNKLYNTHFDINKRDEDMIRILEIENPINEDLKSPSVCSRCFANRDTIIKATLDKYVSENGGELNEALFESTEVKAIYFNLYQDTSGQDNIRLYCKYPSYSSLEEFRRYVAEKFEIDIPGPIAVSTPEPSPTPTTPPALPSRRSRFISRVFRRNTQYDPNNPLHQFIINTSFAQYDN